MKLSCKISEFFLVYRGSYLYSELNKLLSNRLTVGDGEVMYLTILWKFSRDIDEKFDLKIVTHIFHGL